MNNVTIYILVEPITNQVRYIGKTIQLLNKRLSAHLCESNKSNTKKNTWLKNLKKRGLKPKIEELDIVPESEWSFWEQYWICQFKTWGFELKNTDEGGKGGSSEFMKKNNPMHNKKSREKLSKSLMGNQFAKGYKHSEETKKKVSDNNSKFWLGKTRSEKTKDKISKTKSKPVYQFSSDNIFIKKFSSAMNAVRETNTDRTGLYKCLTNKAKRCNGFIWKSTLN